MSRAESEMTDKEIQKSLEMGYTVTYDDWHKEGELYCIDRIEADGHFDLMAEKTLGSGYAYASVTMFDDGGNVVRFVDHT